MRGGIIPPADPSAAAPVLRDSVYKWTHCSAGFVPVYQLSMRNRKSLLTIMNFICILDCHYVNLVFND